MRSGAFMEYLNRKQGLHGKQPLWAEMRRREENMAKRLQVFECEVCGHIVMVYAEGGGTLTCCGQPMTAVIENTRDAAKEKHVPVIEQDAAGCKVKVGAVAHPMEEKHYIEWIELLAGDEIYTRFLKPGEAPEATFPNVTAPSAARAYCNLHGYWKG